jgi:DNA repair protein RadC
MTKPTKKRSKGIVSWPVDERPRERLISRGPHALTDAELIAILLRIGMPGKSAIELGRDLLNRFGSIRNMMRAPLDAWQGIKGLGKAKVAQLHAALELSRRAALPDAGEKRFIKSTSQAAEYFMARMSGLAEEHFRVAYLSRQGKLLEDVLLAEGTVDTVHPQVREIISRALQTNASAMLVAHNHPSGGAEPSESDKILTRDLISTCNPIGIKVLDHLIVTEGKCYSFADSGLLDELRLETLSPVPKKRSV